VGIAVPVLACFVAVDDLGLVFASASFVPLRRAVVYCSLPGTLPPGFFATNDYFQHQLSYLNRVLIPFRTWRDHGFSM
jgi:hypothetical protein